MGVVERKSQGKEGKRSTTAQDEAVEEKEGDEGFEEESQEWEI